MVSQNNRLPRWADETRNDWRRSTRIAVDTRLPNPTVRFLQDTSDPWHGGIPPRFSTQFFRHMGDVTELELWITSDSSSRRGRLLGAVYY